MLGNGTTVICPKSELVRILDIHCMCLVCMDGYDAISYGYKIKPESIKTSFRQFPNGM